MDKEKMVEKRAADKVKKKKMTLFDIAKMVEKDPEVRNRMEENQRKYGTLTEEDLRKVFTI